MSEPILLNQPIEQWLNAGALKAIGFTAPPKTVREFIQMMLVSDKGGLPGRALRKMTDEQLKQAMVALGLPGGAAANLNNAHLRGLINITNNPALRTVKPEVLGSLIAFAQLERVKDFREVDGSTLAKDIEATRDQLHYLSNKDMQLQLTQEVKALQEKNPIWKLVGDLRPLNLFTGYRKRFSPACLALAKEAHANALSALIKAGYTEVQIGDESQLYAPGKLPGGVAKPVRRRAVGSGAGVAPPKVVPENIQQWQAWLRDLAVDPDEPIEGMLSTRDMPQNVRGHLVTLMGHLKQAITTIKVPKDSNSALVALNMLRISSATMDISDKAFRAVIGAIEKGLPKASGYDNFPIAPDQEIENFWQDWVGNRPTQTPVVQEEEPLIKAGDLLGVSSRSYKFPTHGGEGPKKEAEPSFKQITSGLKTQIDSEAALSPDDIRQFLSLFICPEPGEVSEFMSSDTWMVLDSICLGNLGLIHERGQEVCEALVEKLSTDLGRQLYDQYCDLDPDIAFSNEQIHSLLTFARQSSEVLYNLPRGSCFPSEKVGGAPAGNVPRRAWHHDGYAIT